MARHHVRPDGSVGRCDAKEGGRCKFASEGALHFESAAEARDYAAEVLAHRSSGFVKGGVVVRLFRGWKGWCVNGWH